MKIIPKKHQRHTYILGNPFIRELYKLLKIISHCNCRKQKNNFFIKTESHPVHEACSSNE